MSAIILWQKILNSREGRAHHNADEIVASVKEFKEEPVESRPPRDRYHRQEEKGPEAEGAVSEHRQKRRSRKKEKHSKRRYTFLFMRLGACFLAVLLCAVRSFCHSRTADQCEERAAYSSARSDRARIANNQDAF